MRKREGEMKGEMEEGLLCFTPLRKAGIAFFGCLLGWEGGAGGWAWRTGSGGGRVGGGRGINSVHIITF